MRRFTNISLLLTIVLLFGFSNLHAQDEEVWPSPEVEHMYNQARQYLSMGNIPKAITTYKQAIILAPDQMKLYRDLGKAYYMSGEYPLAIKTLSPLLKSPQADAESYQLTAEAYMASNDKKTARSALKEGINRFPNAGILYHEMGKMQEEDEDVKAALRSWLDGIQHDPKYHVNYYEAARTYATTNKPVWAIIYGEMFLSIEHETPRANETRQGVFNAYKQLFESISSDEIPQFGKAKKTQKASSFDEAVRSEYLKLTPVIADGLTTENLTMVRTRFLMNWAVQYKEKYPFSFFSYQEDLLKNGFFDIYDEWLFGKVQSQQEFDSWNKFHPTAIQDFQAWQAKHPYVPVTGDFYNDRKMDDLFPEKNNKR